MAGPEVKKARTAFLYFQKENLARIKQENNLSMGDAMTEVSNRKGKGFGSCVLGVLRCGCGCGALFD
jgi:hypothetical protein